MKKKIPAWLVLTVICIVAAGLLAATNLATKDVIAANAQKEAMETLGKLLPEASAFETLESGISVGKDAGGNVIGYALAAIAQGFGGEVETTVAALPDGTINGIKVGGSNFAETAGLGARAKEPEFQEQFAGKNAPVALTKDGGEIEALSGATITSRAVIKGVNEAMEEIAGEAGFTVESTSTAEHLGDGRYAATAQGFGGPVKVFLTLDENRMITDMTVGDDQFAETAGLGARAKEEDFRSQFIGKTLPVVSGDIDVLAGATITTNAVIEAIGIVNDGLDNGLADAPITETAVLPSPEEEKTEETAEEPAETAGETAETSEAADAGGTEYSATVQGFGGPVTVYLNLDENRTITGLTVGDDQFAETEGLGARAKEEDFRNQFIGKTVPVSMEDIDGLTGATVTTAAVVEAINQAADAQTTDETAEEPAGTPGETEETTEGADVSANKEKENTDKGGESYLAASATVQGFGGPVKVVLTLDGNGVIRRIIIGDDQFAETEGLGALAKGEDFRNQFIGKTVPVSMEDIDCLTGATITTTAVVNAINQAADLMP